MEYENHARSVRPTVKRTRPAFAGADVISPDIKSSHLRQATTPHRKPQGWRILGEEARRRFARLLLPLLLHPALSPSFAASYALVTLRIRNNNGGERMQRTFRHVRSVTICARQGIGGHGQPSSAADRETSRNACTPSLARMHGT